MWNSTARQGKFCANDCATQPSLSFRTNPKHWKNSRVLQLFLWMADCTCSTPWKRQSSFMTTKPKARKFRIRRSATQTPQPARPEDQAQDHAAADSAAEPQPSGPTPGPVSPARELV